jgi:hypothetical protein
MSAIKTHGGNSWCFIICCGQEVHVRILGTMDGDQLCWGAGPPPGDKWMYVITALCQRFMPGHGAGSLIEMHHGHLSSPVTPCGFASTSRGVARCGEAPWPGAHAMAGALCRMSWRLTIHGEARRAGGVAGRLKMPVPPGVVLTQGWW